MKQIIVDLDSLNGDAQRHLEVVLSDFRTYFPGHSKVATGKLDTVRTTLLSNIRYQEGWGLIHNPTLINDIYGINIEVSSETLVLHITQSVYTKTLTEELVLVSDNPKLLILEPLLRQFGIDLTYCRPKDITNMFIHMDKLRKQETAKVEESLT